VVHRAGCIFAGTLSLSGVFSLREEKKQEEKEKKVEQNHAIVAVARDVLFIKAERRFELTPTTKLSHVAGAG